MSDLKPAFVLVHGAWHGAATWDAVTPILESRGYATRTLDLPGAGSGARTPLSYEQRPLDRARFALEPSPNADATQAQRTRAVIELVEKTVEETSGPVILVGHSLGGLTVSAVAEAIPHHLCGTVYLSAFMLPNAMTAVALTGHPAMEAALVKRLIMANPEVVGAMRIDFRSDDEGYRNLLKKCLAADVGEEDFDRLRQDLNCDEPLAVFLTPVTQTVARSGRIPRHYIRCHEDRAIPLQGQNFMIAAVDTEMTVPTNVHDLATSHSSAVAQPSTLAELLISIGARVCR